MEIFLVAFCFIVEIKIISMLDLKDTDYSHLKKSLNGMFIAVETDKRHQDTKLPIILNTWFQVARKQTWFFTDIDNPLHQELTNGHMIVTSCPTYDTCCKTAAILNQFLWINKKWLCYFGDESYVNIPKLVKELSEYNHSDEWYLGRNYEFQATTLQLGRPFLPPFQYAYGRAGWCISRGLADILEENARGLNFYHVCNLFNMAGDSTLGFMLATRIKVPLTFTATFHSHLEPMDQFSEEQLADQITLSHSKSNVVNVCGFSEKKDPTRFFSLHCLLFPQDELCGSDEFKDYPRRTNVFKKVSRFFNKALSKVKNVLGLNNNQRAYVYVR